MAWLVLFVFSFWFLCAPSYVATVIELLESRLVFGVDALVFWYRTTAVWCGVGLPDREGGIPRRRRGWPGALNRAVGVGRCQKSDVVPFAAQSVNRMTPNMTQKIVASVPHKPDGASAGPFYCGLEFGSRFRSSFRHDSSVRKSLWLLWGHFRLCPSLTRERWPSMSASD